MPKYGDVIFGTDGFRGEYTEKKGPALLNQETVAGLTRAFLEYMTKNSSKPVLIVGRDTRESGEILVQTVAKTATKLGVEVWDVGICPTPAVFKIANHHQVLAIVITASHNPHTDNGWKAAINGDKITNEQAKEISDLYWKNLDKPIDEIGAEVLNKSGLSEWYIKEVVSNIVSEFGNTPLGGKSLAVDGANGATSKFTSRILRELGAEVHEFATDGKTPINLGCGAADLSGLKNFLQENPGIINSPNFIGAIANDGDGDRMMAIAKTDNGLKEINGNYVLYALAQGQPGIVGTLYTNSGLVEKLQSEDIGFDQCANGDTAVTAGLRDRQNSGENWTRGGEYTGHHVDTNWLSSGDGVRMACWYASYAVKNGKTFADLYSELELWPEASAKVNIARDRDGKLEQESEVVQEIERIKLNIGNEGRLVVRTSGTEPVVRIWGEAKPPKDINKIIDDLANFMRSRA